MPEVYSKMLYNTHLDTLIKVVEAGSFRRAAEQIGISPSAVLKQITLLEQDLRVTLFDRSRKGVSLTEAGESVYGDAKYIVRYCETAAERARDLYTKQNNPVRIAVSALGSTEELASLWPVLHEKCPDIKCRLLFFESTSDGVKRMISTLGQDADLILGVYDETFLEQFGLRALKFRDVKAVIASSPSSGAPGGGSAPVSAADLAGRTVMLPKKGTFRAADEFRKELEGLREDVRIEDFDMYSLDIYYECQNSEKCLFTYDAWTAGSILLREQAADRKYSGTLGMICRKEPGQNVRRLFEAAQEYMKKYRT